MADVTALHLGARMLLLSLLTCVVNQILMADVEMKQKKYLQDLMKWMENPLRIHHALIQACSIFYYVTDQGVYLDCYYWC